MRRYAWVLGLGFGLVTAGCGGGASSTSGSGAKSAPSGGVYAESGGYGSAGGSGAQPSVASAPPPASPGAFAETESAPSKKSESRTADAAPSTSRADRAAPEPPRERPGLGTEWGETRTSRIREMAFERQSDDPSAVVSIQYNDREGARALASSRDAIPRLAGPVTALGGAVRVTIEGENGGQLETVRIGDRTVVVGNAGQRYSIVLTNRTGRRFEAVASVDGLDVMSGRAASFDQRGYILLPFATVRIDGFRQSERAVAAFRFSKVSESYAAQTGSARNVGVIGVAFFRERNEAPWTEGELDTRDTASPFPGEDPRFARPPR